jgi:hypothetical protein
MSRRLYPWIPSILSVAAHLFGTSPDILQGIWLSEGLLCWNIVHSSSYVKDSEWSLFCIQSKQFAFCLWFIIKNAFLLEHYVRTVLKVCLFHELGRGATRTHRFHRSDSWVSPQFRFSSWMPWIDKFSMTPFNPVCGDTSSHCISLTNSASSLNSAL